MSKKRFLGSQYPLVKGSRGILAPLSGVDQVKADLLQLLLTNPGERVMLPLFGTPLRKLIFEPNDPLLAQKARTMIGDAIKAWEPRIEINQISVTSNFNNKELNPLDFGEENGAILGIKIEFFDPVKINEIQELELQVPISGF
jgi:phage baseplate assembly protein W